LKRPIGIKLKQIDVVALAVILLIIMAAYFLIFREERLKVTELREQEVLLTEQLTTAGETRGKLDQISDEIERIEDSLHEFDSNLPSDKRIHDFLRTVDNLAKANNVHIASIKPGALQMESLYLKIPVSISAEARFLDFYNFLHDLENVPRINKVEELTIERLPGGDACSIEMQLAVFMGRD
jgi:type IV pilus assembly protein PilO